MTLRPHRCLLKIDLDLLLCHTAPPHLLELPSPLLHSTSLDTRVEWRGFDSVEVSKAYKEPGNEACVGDVDDTMKEELRGRDRNY